MADDDPVARRKVIQMSRKLREMGLALDRERQMTRLLTARAAAAQCMPFLLNTLTKHTTFLFHITAVFNST